jgi:peptidoglycan/xylan/chitin deacetylase (PgdA/CDA1 family)
MTAHSGAPPAPIPILVYHAITDRPGADLATWSVSPARFREHLECLRDEGCTPLTVSAFVNAAAPAPAPGAGRQALPERPVVVTFDDGYADFAPAAEDMAERGVAATLYVTTGILDGSPTVGIPRAPMLTADQLAPLEALGVEIGAHSHHHHHIDVAPSSVAHDEVWRPKAILEDLLGHSVASFAYPHGSYRAATREEVRAAGYSSACAVRNSFSSVADNPFSLARLTVRDFTTTDTLRGWLRGTGAPLAPEREALRTKVWRVRRWAAAGSARRQARQA